MELYKVSTWTLFKSVLFHLYLAILLNYSEVGSPVILPLQILPAVISRVMLSPVMFLHDW